MRGARGDERVAGKRDAGAVVARSLDRGARGEDGVGDDGSGMTGVGEDEEEGGRHGNGKPRDAEEACRPEVALLQPKRSGKRNLEQGSISISEKREEKERNTHRHSDVHAPVVSFSLRSSVWGHAPAYQPLTCSQFVRTPAAAPIP